MKVGLISPVWLPVPPEGYGGIESIVYYLILGAQGLPIQYKLFSIGETKKKAEIEKLAIDVGYSFGKGLYEEIADPKKNIWDETIHALSAWQWLEDQKVDIVHDHSGIVSPAIASAREKRPPVLITLHGQLDDPRNPRIQPFYRLINQRKGIYFNSISYAQRKPMPDLCWIGNVYNGIPLEHFPFSQKKRDYLIIIGRITPDKGQLEAIEVAKAAGKDLIIAGKPEDGKEAREYWEKKINPRVDLFLHDHRGDRIQICRTLRKSRRSRIIYFGEANFREKVALYKEALATLMPISWEEPFGLVMIESLACGTPVVGFKRGAVPEIVEDGKTGFVVGTIREMVQAIGNLERISPQDCRQRVEKHFSHSLMAQKYYQLYQEILAKEARS